MFGSRMHKLNTSMKTQPTLSNGLPSGFSVVEEPGGWSVVDDENELVMTARNYKDLRERLSDILETSEDKSELQLVRYLLKNKAKG